MYVLRVMLREMYCNVTTALFVQGLRGGSTAVTALVRDAVLYVAWAGDARCILFQRDATGTKLAAVPLVAPHNAFGVSERPTVS